MDFGCVYKGYCSDMTRTVCVGRPTEEMKRVYETVLRAQLTGIAAARAGATGAQIDGAAREVIQRAGYGEYFGHAFGHGVGAEIHESPNATPEMTSPCLWAVSSPPSRGSICPALWRAHRGCAGAGGGADAGI